MGTHLSSVKRIITRYKNENYSLIKVTKTCSSQDPDDISFSETTDSFLSNEGKFKDHEIDGTLIKAGDIKLYVWPSSLISVPTTSDYVTDGIDRFSIVRINTWKEKDAEVALYIFQIRK